MAITSLLFYYKEIAYFFLTFLLVFAVVLGTLMRSKHVSERFDLNASIAFAIAILFSVSGLVKLVVAIIPYVALLLVAFLGIFIVLFFLGYRLEDVMKSKAFVYTTLIVSILFIVLSFANIYKTEIDATKEQLALLNETVEFNLTGNPLIDITLKYQTQCLEAGIYSQQYSNSVLFCTLLHPRVLGVYIMLAILGITTFAIVMRTRIGAGQ